jgi:hypothetical protein
MKSLRLKRNKFFSKTATSAGLLPMRINPAAGDGRNKLRLGSLASLNILANLVTALGLKVSMTSLGERDRSDLRNSLAHSVVRVRLQLSWLQL